MSYFFNFTGPSLAIDTACSSSLTAVHQACQSINNGECKVAIAGGVNVSIDASKYLFLCQNKFLSTDGKCRSFGADGSGYVPGEGVGALLLKPLNDALQDNDNIYGIIRATALSHGGKTNGYTVPNPNMQSEMIKDTLTQANINPHDISYVEAHGTGTSLGDPIEITGLSKAYAGFTKEKQYSSIGSVKSNIGHLETAAGVAGITKVLLQMKHKQLVPSIHSEELNPNIDFSKTPFYVQQKLEDWTVKKSDDGQESQRLASISSFGAGGSYAYAVIEEYKGEGLSVQKKKESVNKPYYLVALSAKSEKALKRKVEELLQWLEAEEMESDLASVSYTLNMGRAHFSKRCCVVAGSVDELKQILEQVKQGKKLDYYLEGDEDEIKASEQAM